MNLLNLMNIDISVQQRDSILQNNAAENSIYQRVKWFAYSRLRNEIDEIRSESSIETISICGFYIQK